MNKILFLVLASLIVSGCSNSQQINGSSVADAVEPIEVDKLEIYHFHGTHQCYSCITVGDYAEETVNTYFADELKSGKIVFGHINGELAENRDLVAKYRVNSASLWIGTYTKDGKFIAEQNTNVWYKVNDKEDYLAYLKGIIEKRLAGDLS